MDKPEIAAALTWGSVAKRRAEASTLRRPRLRHGQAARAACGFFVLEGAARSSRPAFPILARLDAAASRTAAEA